MNCKPGDLAVIVRAKTQQQHVGKIVKCVRVYDGDAWITEPALTNKQGVEVTWFDVHLRPIRDNPGNEAWVTEARKELTKHKTEITTRGEPA